MNPTLDDYDKVAVEIHAVPVFQAVISEGARETLDVAAADTLYLRRHGQLSVAQYNTAIILRDILPIRLRLMWLTLSWNLIADQPLFGSVGTVETVRSRERVG